MSIESLLNYYRQAPCRLIYSKVQFWLSLLLTVFGIFLGAGARKLAIGGIHSTLLLMRKWHLPDGLLIEVLDQHRSSWASF